MGHDAARSDGLAISEDDGLYMAEADDRLEVERNTPAAHVDSSPVAHSRLWRLAGGAFAVGGGLTFVLGAASFVLLPIAAPIAALQIAAGLRLYGGRSRWLWLAVPCALFGLWLGAAYAGGFAAPVGWATAGLSGAALVAGALAAFGD